MGGPKVWLAAGGGTPLLALHVARLRGAGCEVVVVVVRPELVVAVWALAGPGARVVGAATASQAESLAVGLEALGAAAAVVAVTPVDLLPAREDTLRALVAAVDGGAVAATPRFLGRGGHPVVVRRAALRPALPLRDVLAALGAARVRVDVDDAAVVGDFDTPAEALAAGVRLHPSPA